MKYLLLILTFLISTSDTYSQYIPMLEEGNTWSVDVHYEPFDPPEPPYWWIITEQISIGDIENIDGIDYYRVWSEDQATCLLREEAGIVYKYDELEEVDKILFDFTLEEGDTFNLIDSAYNSYGFCSIIGTDLWESELNVDTVEDIEIAGELRKVITFLEYGDGDFTSFQWIEGIGNISGFDILWGWIDIASGSKLVCFTTNGTTYFFNDVDSCDNTTLGINEVSKSKAILYPNPVINKSILQFPTEGYADTIRIFDVHGKLVKKEPIPVDYYTIDAMLYRSGLYFYQLFSNNKLINTDTFIVK